MDPKITLGDCRNMFKCRRCETVFDVIPNAESKLLLVSDIVPLKEVSVMTWVHECQDGSGAICVADFIGLIPIIKP